MKETQLLTVAEVAAALNMSPSGVRRMVLERRIPFVRVGRLVRFDAGEVSAFVKRNRVEAVNG